ncbi:MAG: hypothetical protein COB17_00600 [Sulfurimonas sp.]|nr:MAG: hypothetical protein COB17_00600 [Sulfurimonas sp.]
MKVLILISLLVSLVFASIGQVTGIKGKATLFRDATEISLILGQKIEKKDIIKTGDKAKVQIIFNDNTIITIGKKSNLDIEEYLYDSVSPEKSNVKLKFFRGAFKAITGKVGKFAPSRFKLKTKNATIGIRGTILEANQNRVVCEKGSITVSSNGVTQIVPAGMMTTTPPNAPPTPPVAFKAGSISLEDEAEEEEEKEKEAKAKEDKKDKEEKSEDKEDKKEKSEKKSEEKKSKEKKSEETKSEDKKTSTQSNAESNEESGDNQQETVVEQKSSEQSSGEATVVEQKSEVAPVQAETTVIIDVEDNPNVDVVVVDTPSASEHTAVAAITVSGVTEVVTDTKTATETKENKDVVDALIESGVSLGEGATIVDGKVIIDGETIEVIDGEVIVDGEVATIVDGKAVDEEAQRIAEEEIDALGDAEEEAADLIAEEEIAALVVAEEEAARIAEEEAARIAEEEADALLIAEEEAAALIAAEEASADTTATTQAAADTITNTLTFIENANIITTPASSASSSSYLDFGTWADSSASTSGLYIVGELTHSEVIQDLINTPPADRTYSGSVEAIETVSGTTSSVSGTMGLTINFATQQITSGSINVNSGYWNASIISGTINKFGFETTGFSGSTSPGNAISGSLNGDFYGPSANEIGGEFNLKDDVTLDTVKGVFGTTGGS